MPDRELEIRITGSASDLGRSTKQANKYLKDLDKGASRTSRGLRGIGTAAKVGAAAGLAAIAFEGKRVVEAYAESYKVEKQTQAVLKSTGNAAKVTADHVGNLSTEISLKTGVDDEAIQSGENLLLTFKNIQNGIGKGNKIFDQTTKIMVDMSTAMDQDFKSSAIQLGKALNDPIKGMSALSRVGVTFSDTQAKTIEKMVASGKTMQAQKVILKELKSEFGGSAAAQATSMDKAKVAVGNLEESLGKALFPTVSKVAGAIATFVTQIQTGKGAGGDFKRVIQQAAKKVDEFGTVVGAKFRDAVAAVKKFWKESAITRTVVIGAFKYIKGVVADVIPAVISYIKGMAKVIRGVVKVISGILTGDFGRAWSGVKDIFSGGIQAIFGILRAVTAPIRGIIGGIGTIMGKAFSAVWDGVTGVFESGVNKVIGVVNKMIELVNNVPGIDIGLIGTLGGSSPGKTKMTKQEKSRGYQKKAAGGFIVPGAGSGDIVDAALPPGSFVMNKKATKHYGLQRGGLSPVMLEPQERVFLPHEVKKYGVRNLEGMNKSVPRFSIGGAFESAAGSVAGAARDVAGSGLGFVLDKLPTPSDVLPGFLGGFGDYIKKQLVEWVKGNAKSPSGPTGATRGPKGIGVYKGVPMANWVIEALQYAASRGAAPQPTSGYRSHEQNVAEGRYYHSEHEEYQYPGGAVDFGSYTSGLAEKMSVVNATAGFKYPLLAPIGFHDDGHASGTGHKRGGRIQRLAGGGVVDSITRVLANHGFDPEAIAGIVGNAYGESGYDPSADDGAGNGGLWGFTTSPVSFNDMKAFAAKMGVPWTNAAMQTQFMLSHGEPTGMELRDKLNAANTTDETTSIFMHEWERPENYSSLGKRQSAASSALKGIGSGGSKEKVIPHTKRQGHRLKVIQNKAKKILKAAQAIKHQYKEQGGTKEGEKAIEKALKFAKEAAKARKLGNKDEANKLIEKSQHELERSRASLKAAEAGVFTPGLKPSALLPSAAGLAPQFQKMLKARGLTYSGKLAIGEGALEAAGETADHGDDFAAYAYQKELIQGNKKRLQKQLNQVNKSLGKKMTKSQRAKLLGKRSHIEEELSSANQGLSSIRSGEKGLNEEEDPYQAALEAQTEAIEKAREVEEEHNRLIQEQMAEEKALRDELELNRHIAESAQGTAATVAQKALADIISGELGPRINLKAQTAGAGTVGTF